MRRRLRQSATFHARYLLYSQTRLYREEITLSNLTGMVWRQIVDDSPTCVERPIVAEPGPTATDPAIARDGERAETGGNLSSMVPVPRVVAPSLCLMRHVSGVGMRVI
jgi:hypothetical protein